MPIRRDRDGKFANGPVTPPRPSDTPRPRPAVSPITPEQRDQIRAAYDAFVQQRTGAAGQSQQTGYSMTPPAGYRNIQQLTDEQRAAGREHGLVDPVTCKRCGGTGMVTARRTHHGVPGLCFRCNGFGMEEGDAEQIKINTARAKEAKARAKAAYELRAAAFEKVRQDVPRFVPLAEQDTVPSQHTVTGGIGVLESLEPDRLDHALESIVAGHPGVYQALHDYFLANAERLNSATRSSRGLPGL